MTINSKPDHGLTLVDKGGKADTRLQLFFDEIEQRLNDSLLGIGIQNIVYTVATLPIASTQGLDIGMQAYVTDEAALGSVPVWFDGVNWKRADGVIAT